MINRGCGDDREFIRAVAAELLKAWIQTGQIQEGLYDCNKNRLGQWTQVARCADIPEIPEYKNCRGEPIISGATLATCADVDDKIADIPKIISFSTGCKDQSVTVNFDKGEPLVMDLSCLVSAHEDIYVTGGRVEGGSKLILTRSGAEDITIDVSSIRGTGSGGGIADGNTTNTSLTYENGVLTLVDSDGNALTADIVTERHYTVPPGAMDTSTGLPYEKIGLGEYTLTKPDRMERVQIGGEWYFIPAYRDPVNDYASAIDDMVLNAADIKGFRGLHVVAMAANPDDRSFYGIVAATPDQPASFADVMAKFAALPEGYDSPSLVIADKGALEQFDADFDTLPVGTRVDDRIAAGIARIVEIAEGETPSSYYPEAAERLSIEGKRVVFFDVVEEASDANGVILSAVEQSESLYPYSSANLKAYTNAEEAERANFNVTLLGITQAAEVKRHVVSTVTAGETDAEDPAGREEDEAAEDGHE